jgi:hypothetical protein
MSLTQIGRDSTADVLLTLPTLTSKSYKCQFFTFSVRAVTPPIVRTTFCNESNPQQDPGDTTYIVTFAGLLKKGVDGSNGIAILAQLLTNPYNVPGTWQYDTGCSVAATDWAFKDCEGTRTAGIDATFQGSCDTTSDATLAWVIA